MGYRNPSTVYIDGIVTPNRPMTASEAIHAYHVINENGLNGILEVKKDNPRLGEGYYILASWSGEKCISLTARNWAFATNIATIFADDLMKDIGFSGMFNIENHDILSHSQRLTVNGSEVVHRDSTPYHLSGHVPVRDATKETVVQPLPRRS